MKARAESLLHPVRLRVVQAIASARALSAKELSARLDDVPHATLYRHVRALRDEGWLEPESERKARGAIETRYRLREGAAVAGAADLEGASADDHQRWFTTFTAHLLGGFSRYLARGEPDLVRDGVGYRMMPLHLSDDELAQMTSELSAVVLKYFAQPPSEERRPRLFATVLMPDVDADAKT